MLGAIAGPPAASQGRKVSSAASQRDSWRRRRRPAPLRGGVPAKAKAGARARAQALSCGRGVLGRRFATRAGLGAQRSRAASLPYDRPVSEGLAPAAAQETPRADAAARGFDEGASLHGGAAAQAGRCRGPLRPGEPPSLPFPASPRASRTVPSQARPIRASRTVPSQARPIRAIRTVPSKARPIRASRTVPSKARPIRASRTVPSKARGGSETVVRTAPAKPLGGPGQPWLWLPVVRLASEGPP